MELISRSVESGSGSSAFAFWAEVVFLVMTVEGNAGLAAITKYILLCAVASISSYFSNFSSILRSLFCPSCGGSVGGPEAEDRCLRLVL